MPACNNYYKGGRRRGYLMTVHYIIKNFKNMFCDEFTLFTIYEKKCKGWGREGLELTTL